MNFDDMIDDVIAASNKRKELCKDSPLCDKCGTDQVQLVDWINGIEWKCRHCHHVMKRENNERHTS